MDWEKLRHQVYYIDGSLRDIYVLEATREDWLHWINFINGNYSVSFHLDDSFEEQIDFAAVTRIWSERTSSCVATVHIGNIKVKTYFFTDREIESDLSPKEIKSIEDHEHLIQYMKAMAAALNKKVLLTPENAADAALISVGVDEVTFHIN